MAPSNRRQGGRQRRLSLAVLLALVLHAILAYFFPQFLRIPESQRPETVTILSTTDLEHRDRPLPPNIHKPVMTESHPQPVTPAEVPKHELSKDNPHAPPQPPSVLRKPSEADILARQEAQFAKTAQKLHDADNPLAVGSPGPPPAARQLSSDVGQSRPTNYYAQLTPLKHWFEGGLSCYYTSYHMQTSTGGFEDGDIPWPICYPRNHDAMLPLNVTHNLPVPLPPPGFSTSDYLTPFLQDIYDAIHH